jgi:hypothetical protein
MVSITNEEEDDSDLSKISLCPEEIIMVRDKWDQDHPVLISYDLASDSKLSNRQVIRDLAQQTKKVRYTLRTANGHHLSNQMQGVVDIIQLDKTTVPLTFTSIQDGGVLDRNHLIWVAVPKEIQSLINMPSGSAYHIVLGSGPWPYTLRKSYGLLWMETPRSWNLASLVRGCLSENSAQGKDGTALMG